METPSLRGRVVLAGVLTGAVLILLLDVFVWLSLRDRLLDNLEGVLDSRVTLVQEVATGLTPRELDQRLTELGVPGVVHAPGGDLAAEPIAPIVGELPPADPLGPVVTAIERELVLEDGTRVTVLASRAGVDATLRRVLLLESVGSAVAVALLLALLARVSRRALRPLDQAVITARRIASGQTGERLRPDRPDTELGRMASAFDEMLDALEAALAESRAAEVRTRTFLAQAAHQLRTPVAALRTSVDALLRVRDEEERDRLLDHLARETARTSRLVRSLLRLAELDEAPTAPSATGPVDLDRLVRDEVSRADAWNADVSVTVDGRAGTVLADGDALREALANLLDNAVRYADGLVAVGLGRDGEAVTVHVRDDGPGVPDGQEEAVFGRFVSLDGAGGSGLGLAISRAIARGHGGDVRYVAGEFELRLPSAGPPPA